MTPVNTVLPSGRKLQVFAASFYAIVWGLYSFTWPYSRSLGATALAVVLFAACLPVLAMRRLYLPWQLVALWLVVALSVLYSCLQAYPVSWPKLHVIGAIPQQSASYLALPLVLSANVCTIAVFAQERRLFVRWVLPVTLVSSIVINPLFLTYLVDELEGNPPAPLHFFRINGFSNGETLLIALIGYWLIRSRKFFAPSFVSLLLGASSTNLSPQIAFAILPMFKVKSFARLALAGVIIVLIGAVVIAPLFSSAIDELDGNSGIRAVFWGDAWKAVLDTWGLGVGFGTESIRPFYMFEGVKWVLREETAEDFIMVGVHNSFAQISFRTGIIGGFLLLSLVLRLFPMGRSLSDLSRFDCWLLAILLVSFSVNVAIVSMNHFWGMTAIWAWLVLRHDRRAIIQFRNRSVSSVDLLPENWPSLSWRIPRSEAWPRRRGFQ